MIPVENSHVIILSLIVILSLFTLPSAFAAEVSVLEGSGVPGCEETDECWFPSVLTVNVGETVTWSNDDNAAHTVSSGSAADGLDGIFDSSLFMAATEFSHTFDEAGTFEYFCMVHPWMVGTVIVVEAGAEEEMHDDSSEKDTSVSIRLEIDSKRYHMGDTLYLNGSVSPADNSVYIQIINPTGEMIINDRVTPSPSGIFNKNFKIAGTDWRHAGTFTLTVISGDSNEKESFVVLPKVEPPIIPESSDKVTIETAAGSGAPGCEETRAGCFIPSIASVELGGTVIMSNTDSAAHTFTAGTASGGPSGQFDTSLLMVNQSFQYTADTAGQIPYFCMVHPWMQGLILVGDSGTFPPEPEPVEIELDISLNDRVFDLGNLVIIHVTLGGDVSKTIAIEVLDPRDTAVVSRSVHISANSSEAIEFRISEDFKPGNYKVIATTSHAGKTVSDTAFFKIKSQFNSFKITSVDVTDQQGNPSNLEAGELGFIKVNLESSKSITTLVTVNIFDADLTSIGIGSIKTTLSSGNSEIILSFMIPIDAAIGPAEIFVNAFSDWPSNGGVPLTSEVSVVEEIR